MPVIGANELTLPAFDSSIQSLAFSPDGQRIAVLTENAFYTMSAGTGSLQWNTEKYSGGYDVKFSPDGT